MLTSGLRDQPRGLFFKDSPALLPKDPTQTAMNRAMVGWDKRTRELTKDSVGAVLDFMYPVPGHPPMRLEPRFVEFVSFLSPCLSFHLNFWPPDANLEIAGLAEGIVLQR